MEEKDITLADMILASLMSESEHIMLYVIHEKATDEAQAQRVILSLCSYGAAHETDIHLEKTDKTASTSATTWDTPSRKWRSTNSSHASNQD